MRPKAGTVPDDDPLLRVGHCTVAGIDTSGWHALIDRRDPGHAATPNASPHGGADRP